MLTSRLEILDHIVPTSLTSKPVVHIAAMRQRSQRKADPSGPYDYASAENTQIRAAFEGE